MGCILVKFQNKVDSNYEFRLKNKKDILNRVTTKKKSQDFELPISWSRTKIEKCYTIVPKPFGQGHFGYIRKGYFKNNNYRYFAIKTIKRNYMENNATMILNELNIWRTLDHPNIIQFYETYYDSENYHFVTELCEGGDLEEFLSKKQIIKENDAKKIMFQVFLAINHIHQKGVCHRDIKLENFLFLDKNYNTIKLIDFGLSKNFVEDKMSTLLGTPYYVAPEILNGSYTSSCDNWSAGIMLFILLNGKPPFIGDNKKQLFNKILRSKPNFEKETWNKISSSGRDLILKLLNKNSEKRIKAVDVLDHQWFKEVFNKSLNLGKNIWTRNLIDKLLNYKSSSTFKGEILKLLVGLYNIKNEIKILNNAYFYLDYNNSGFIQKAELEIFFKEFNVEITDKEINNLIKNLYLKEENLISYTEFIVSWLDLKTFLTEDKIKTLFERFDVDNSGYITIENLKECFKRFGFRWSINYLKNMINEFGKETIYYKDFKEILNN